MENTNNQEEPLDSKIRYNSSLSSKNEEPPKPIQEQKVDVLPTLSNQIKTEESMVPPYFHGTLNEPILSTLKRDLLNIWYKMPFVLNPFADQRKKKLPYSSVGSMGSFNFYHNFFTNYIN